uniref:dITP/XTP pyrophosphatase n=1 Tax=candidate division WOR-3 bacterium TaxID=2052148 RepID=A0A7C4GDR3_UNCW3
MTLIIATHNPGKLKEIAELMGGAGWHLKSLADICPGMELSEPGPDFESNARQKARDAFAELRTWVLAEDSGLEVDALDGEPGVMSARFCGLDASDWERNRVLLERIIAVPDEKRTARFRCAACVIDPAGTEALFEGVCHGRISHHQRGRSGFGFDPIFIPNGYSRTFAELGRSVKNRVSHRAQALSQVAGYLRRRVRIFETGLRNHAIQPEQGPSV